MLANQGMSNNSMTARCSHCDNPCDPNDTSPCQKCGKIGRNVSIVINETLTLSEKIRVSRTSEYYERHPKTTGALITIWLCSTVMGYFIGDMFGALIGGLIGAIAFVLPPSIIKVRNTETFS